MGKASNGVAVPTVRKVAQPPVRKASDTRVIWQRWPRSTSPDPAEHEREWREWFATRSAATKAHAPSAAPVIGSALWDEVYMNPDPAAREAAWRAAMGVGDDA